ncbi:MAG: site-specific DNA-methyltransferase, partial [Acidobacteriia bacterium]|nr:site-specific DNA-methyltransferase [Terriglobia bacterium]
EENLHRVRSVLDEILGADNFCGLVTFVKTSAQEALLLPSVCDYLLWYAKDKEKVKFRKIWRPKSTDDPGTAEYNRIELADGNRRSMTGQEVENWSLLPKGSRAYRQDNIVSQRPPGDFPVEFEGTTYRPITGYWKSGIDGMAKLIDARRIEVRGKMLSYVRYFEDFPYKPIANFWSDVRFSSRSEDKQYVVQTAAKVIERCILMTTDPGDLVFDPTCGSGTTAYVAEEWGRRWITCDTSRVAVTLSKQRLMATHFDYYELAHPEEGIASGFQYKAVPHVMLKSVANNPEIRGGMTREQIDLAIARYADQETLCDQPYIDKGRVRVTGPFTVEAVPAPTVRSLDDIEVGNIERESQSSKTQQSLADFRHAATPLLDASVARSGATLRHTEWRDELLKTGLRGKGGNQIDFSRVEPLAGTRWLHADAETKGVKPERVVISFGPEHSLLDPRQVESAWQEARTLIPRPAMIVFAAFEFDPQAAKEIDELTKEKTGMTFLSAQMNADLLTADLKKKRASNQSFWLVGRPDVDLRQIAKGDHKGKWEVEVKGFDYYNTRTGTIDSGDVSKIAMWLLDSDYDGRSLYPRQVFFPLADSDGGWAPLAKNLKAEIDPDLIEAYRGTVSLPFEPGNYVAVKVIDDRGIESLKVVEVK